MILIVAVFGIIALWLASQVEVDQETTKWIWITGPLKGTTFTSTEGTGPRDIFLGILAILFIALVATVLAATRKFDFVGNGAPMKGASSWRRVVLVVSILVGYTGVDRFLMKRTVLGLLKLALFAWFFVAVRIYLSGLATNSPLTGGSFIIAAVSFVPVFFWWTVDILFVLTGLAQTRGKVYLR
ncbi:MAG: hypothetical protein LBN10_12395 [Propionibacteriaceae bacterium]|jgi:small-conductance mechanosensitive channel|nr:hypothetical protein [Propionibacteriaceae bacterium]